MALLDKQLNGYNLTTAKILYHMPDYNNILQEYVWQDYDLAPKFPVLGSFLDFWTREIDGALHSVYVGKNTLITPSDHNFTDWEGTIQ